MWGGCFPESLSVDEPRDEPLDLAGWKPQRREMSLQTLLDQEIPKKGLAF